MEQHDVTQVRTLFLVLVSSFLSVAPSSADPVVAVAGGWNVVCGVEGCQATGIGLRGSADFNDPNLNLFFGGLVQLGATPFVSLQVGPSRCLPTAPPASFAGCEPGTPIPLNTTLTGPFAAAPAMIGGIEYSGSSVRRTLFLTGTVQFTTRDVAVIPAEFGVFVTPFDMFASLTGYRDESFSEPPLFSLNILGEGLLTLTNEPRSFSGLVSTTEFRYRLAPVAAPVPEPLTAGLVAAGLAVVARRYQRDRARRRVPG